MTVDKVLPEWQPKLQTTYKISFNERKTYHLYLCCMSNNRKCEMQPIDIGMAEYSTAVTV